MEYSLYHPSQTEEITALFLNTFTDSEGEVEGNMVSNLALELMTTTEKEELFVFIAHEKKCIVGAILFSRITFEEAYRVFILSPVAISTHHQGKGIGQRLISVGLQYLKDQKVDVVLTYGDPDFYSKVGFKRITQEQSEALYR